MNKVHLSRGLLIIGMLFLLVIALVYMSSQVTPGTVVTAPPSETPASGDEASGDTQSSIKNNGISSSQAAGIESVEYTGSVLAVGSRVMAVVSSPSGNSCLNAGDMGTLVCYDEGDPNLPYLVNWDRPGCGVEQSQTCAVVADNGWWVAYTEVGGVVFLPVMYQKR